MRNVILVAALVFLLGSCWRGQDDSPFLPPEFESHGVQFYDIDGAGWGDSLEFLVEFSNTAGGLKLLSSTSDGIQDWRIWVGESELGSDNKFRFIDEDCFMELQQATREIPSMGVFVCGGDSLEYQVFYGQLLRNETMSETGERMIQYQISETPSSQIVYSVLSLID